MPKALIMVQAPELRAFIECLLQRTPGWTPLRGNSPEETLRSPGSPAPDVVILDDAYGLDDFQAFRARHARLLRRTRIIHLDGRQDHPSRAALGRWDQVLVKPFGAAQFQGCLGQAVGRLGWVSAFSPAAWKRRIADKLDYYTPAQALMMGAVLLLLLFNVGKSARDGFGWETGVRAVFWGAILLLCSLFGHVRDKHLRWEGLLFAKFALLVSLLPPLHSLPSKLQQGVSQITL